MLKLVPKYTNRSQCNLGNKLNWHESVYTDDYFNKESFCLEFNKVSLNLYSLHARDNINSLFSSIKLSREYALNPFLDCYSEEIYQTPMLVCDFPAIEGQSIIESVLRDEYLLGMVLIQFYLKILEALFVFSDEIGAEGLILNVYEDHQDFIEIFRDFIVMETLQEDQDNGYQTQLIISNNLEAYDHLIDYQEHLHIEFIRNLWRDQSTNSAIRQYLKRTALQD